MSRKKTCEDYDDETRHNDYVRHIRRGEDPCQPSVQAWRKKQRQNRQENGVWEPKEKLPDPSLQVQVDWHERIIDIRQSAIQDFLDCRRKFYWGYIVGIEFDFDDGPRPWTTADYGTAFHEAMGAYYLGKDWKRAIRTWGKKIWPEGPPSDADLEMVKIMVQGHIDDLAEDGADIGEETVAVEEEIVATVVDVNGWTVRIHGKVDRRIELENGIKIIDDWKSTTKLDSTLQYIQQLGRYAVIVRAATGWRADRVRSTQVKRVKRQGQGPFYSRPWLALNEDAYAMHAANLRAVLTDIATCIENDGPWYEHVTGECSWKCRVQTICQAQQQGDDPGMLVDLHYRKKLPR
jgi:hypothetical protein